MTSTIDAQWAELAPGTVAPLAQYHTGLSSPLDVLRLVEQLAQPHISEACLIHAGRPRVISTVTGRTKADHGLVIAVHDGRGYANTPTVAGTVRPSVTPTAASGTPPIKVTSCPAAESPSISSRRW